MWLGLIFVCIASWTLADTVDDVKTIAVESNTEYNDETRRGSGHPMVTKVKSSIPQMVMEDNFRVGAPLIRNKLTKDELNEMDNGTESNEIIKQSQRGGNTNSDTEVLNHLISRSFAQSLTPGQRESNGICKNGEFLIKILTSIIPLLKHEVPENRRTSYVLEIIKDLLKDSPEAAQDHEVMYKINDLMQTLDKYHVKELSNPDVLRTSRNDLDSLDGVKSKIVFKYDLPNFQNTKCTVELLMIIKVVQEAILRLVNNPVCKEEIKVTGVPFVTNVDTLLKNPYLYSPFGPSLYPLNGIPNILYKNINPTAFTAIPYFPYQNYPSNEALQFFPDSSGPTEPYPYFGPKIPQIITPDSLISPEKLPHFDVIVPKQGTPIYEVNFPQQEIKDIIFPDNPVINLPLNFNNIYDTNTEKYSGLPINFPPLDKNIESLNNDSPVPPYFMNSYGSGLPYPEPPYIYGSLPSMTPLTYGGISNKPVFQSPKIDLEEYILSITPSPFRKDIQDFSKLKPIIPATEPNTAEFDQLDDYFYKKYPSEKPLILLPDETDTNPFLLPIDDNISDNLSDFYAPPKKLLPSSIEDDEFESTFVPENQTPKSLQDYLSLQFEHPLEQNNYWPFEVTGGGSGEVNIGQNRPISSGLPLKRPKLNIKDLYPSLNVIGDDKSTDDYKGKDLYNPAIYKDTMLKEPSTLPFYTDGDGLGVVPIGQNEPISLLQYDLPRKHLQYPLPADLLTPSSQSLPFEVIGNGGSADIDIGPHLPSSAYIFDLPQKPPSYSDVVGEPSGYDLDNKPSMLHIKFPMSSTTISPLFSASEHFLIDKLTDHFETIPMPGKKTSSPISNKYDKSPLSLPLINGKPDIYSPSYDPNAESDDSTHQYPYIPNYPLPLLSKKPLSFPQLKDVGESDEFPKDSYQKPSIDNFLHPYHPQRPYNKPDYELSSQESVINLPSQQPNYLDDYYTPGVPYVLNKGPNIVKKTKYASNKRYPSGKGQNKLSHEDFILLYPYLQDSVLQHLDSTEKPNVLSKNNYYLGYPIRPKELHGPINPSPQEDNLDSRPSHTPNIDFENYYTMPYQDNNFYNDKPADSYYDANYEPSRWHNIRPNNIPKILLPEFTYTSSPDERNLVTIKDNIDVIESVIPKTLFDSFIREHIKIIKELLNLKEITIEEYVTIINQYEILITYIEKLNIDSEISKELQLYTTNEGEIDVQTGKTNVVELTYLIKRPTPLIYQPYYYIKYRLPYASFVTKMETILASKPDLSRHPSQLYKELIPMSELAEKSPDLEGFAEDDIIKLTFGNGTLVGTKIIKEKDVDLYATLDMLKEINTDYTVEDVHKLIKNLDVQLKNQQNGVGFNDIIKPGSIGHLNDFNLQLDPNESKNLMDKIVVKINKKPTITNKITKITTKKVTSDEVIANILEKVNNLRSNQNYSQAATRGGHISENNVKINSEPTSETFQNIQSRDLNKHLLLNSPNIEKYTESVHQGDLNGQTKTKDKLAFDYFPMYSDISVEHLNYFSKMNNAIYNDDTKLSQETFNSNKQNISPTLQVKRQPSVLYNKLLHATIQANENLVTSPKSHQYDVVSETLKPKRPIYYRNELKSEGSLGKVPGYGQSAQSLGAKLLDATIKAHNYKVVNDPKPDLNYESYSMLPKDSVMVKENPNFNFVNTQVIDEPRISLVGDKGITNSYLTQHSIYDISNSNNAYSNIDNKYQMYDTNKYSNLSPNWIKYYQNYQYKQPLQLVNRYNAYTYDNPANLGNKYDKTFSYFYNPRLYMNDNQNINKNNFINHNIKLYQDKRAYPYYFNPSTPLGTG